MTVAREQRGPSLRYRIDFLLMDGREATRAEIARDLRASDSSVRQTVRRMLAAGEVATRGDGWLFVTEATRRQLAARAVRRGPRRRPVAPIVERHLTHLRKRGLRPASIVVRRRVVARLEVWLQAQGVGLLEVTPELLERFVDFTRGNAGRRSVVRNLNGFYKWLVEYEDALASNPARRLVLPREIPGLPRPISEERLAQAVDEAPEPIRAWLILAGWCGLRCMEIAQLHEHDVDLDARTLTVRDGKGGHPRVVPVVPIVADALERHLGAGYLFARIDPPPGPISADEVSHIANRFLRRIGIPDTAHSLRHRFATQVYEASGYDVIATQRLLGHRSIASTSVYARSRPNAQLHDVVAQLPHLARRGTNDEKTA
ncbi:MAG: tyrosine-type recombinase/integrase [Actinomycetota bacterium]|nr:tyrosine-type recombinase/integrase [Actinomycetota bacterium]